MLLLSIEELKFLVENLMVIFDTPLIDTGDKEIRHIGILNCNSGLFC